ncbi:MAG: hypothetical protein J6B22_03865 [Clostridia bacterium]|nr:hypothetical protein [Clostridia bacterium]
MEIFLIILAVIVFLITAMLLLPIHFIIKNDERNNFSFICKVLWFTFGDGKRKSKSLDKLKKKVGADKKAEKGEEKKDIVSLVRENLGLLKDVLKEIVGLLRHCKGESFELEIICSSKDAALSAIHYGECCAVAYPILGFINSIIKVKDRKRKIDIRCEYEVEWSVTFNFDLSVRICHILAAAFRVLKKKIKK